MLVSVLRTCIGDHESRLEFHGDWERSRGASYDHRFVRNRIQHLLAGRKDEAAS